MADSIVLRISGDSQELVRAVNTARTSLQQFNVAVRQTGQQGQGLATIDANLGRIGESLSGLGTRITAAVTVPIAAAAAGSFKAAADFDSAFANVRKTLDTTNLSIEQETRLLDQMRTSIRDMATEIPQTTDELSRIASLGAQMGVSNAGLVSFTRTVADLGVAIDGLTVESAATGLAQLRNITKDSEADFSRMASTLVDLGNKSAATEAGILDFTLRLAGAGKEIGLQTPEIFALGTALASVGLNAEAGGTAMSRTMTQMQNAVEVGGESLQAFADIAGKSAEEFATIFRTRPIEAIQLFLRGLKDAKEGGQALSLVLGDLGVEGVRQMDTLRRSSSAADLFAKAVTDGTTAWRQNTAATEEARKKYETTYNQLTVFWNRIRDIGITIGGPLIKGANAAVVAVGPLVDLFGTLAEMFASLPGEIQAIVFGFGGIVALAGPMLYFGGQIVVAVKATHDLVSATKALAAANAAATLTGMGSAATGAAGAVTALRLAMLSLGAASVVGAVVAAGAVIKSTHDRMMETLAAREQYLRDQQAIAAAERMFGDAARDGNQARKEIADHLIAQAKAQSEVLAAERLARIEARAKGGPFDPDAVAARIELARITGDQTKLTLDNVRVQELLNAANRKGADATKAQTAALTPLQKAQKQYTDDLEKRGLKAFQEAAALHQLHGRTVEEAAKQYQISASSLDHYIKKNAEAAKPDGPIGKLRKAIKELDVELSHANANLTDREIAESYGDQVGKIVVAAKALGVAVTDNITRAMDATDRWASSESFETVREELQSIADTIANLQETQDQELADATKRAARSLIGAQRQQAREREAIWQSSLQRQISQVQQWGDDLKRENFGVIADYEEFAASVDRIVHDKIQDVLITSDEWRKAVALIPGQYGALLSLALPPLQKTKDKTEETKTKTDEWDEALRSVAASLADLAQVSGDTWGGVLKTIGQVVNAVSTLKQSITSVGAGLAQIGAGGFKNLLGGIANMSAGLLGVVSAAISVGKALHDAFVKPRWEVTMERIGREFGAAITRGLSEKIEEDAKTIFGGDRQAAKLWNIGDIIDEAGLNAGNLDLMMARLRDVFSMVETGAFSADQARQTLDNAFPKFAQHILDSGAFFSEQFREIIALNNRMGIESKEIAEFVAQMATRQGANLSKLSAPLVKELDTIVAKMDEADKASRELRREQDDGPLSRREQGELDKWDRQWDTNRDKLLALQPEIENVGHLIVSTFENAQASGLSYAESLMAVADAARSIQPAWDKLKALGVDFNNEILDQIINEAALVEKHKELVDAVAAGNDILKVASSLGRVTQEQFNAVAEVQAKNAERMSAAGFSQRSILQQMLPFLQQAVELNKEQGIAIDATTQKYIDQAKEAGLSLERQKTETDILTEGFKNTNLALVALIEALGGDVPEALRKLADEAVKTEDKLGGITDGLVEMHGKFGDITRRAKDTFDEIVDGARDAQDEVDTLNFGHSPGGLKEIPILLSHSKIAWREFSDDMLGRLRTIKRDVDDASRWKIPAPELPDEDQMRRVIERRERDRTGPIVVPKPGDDRGLAFDPTPDRRSEFSANDLIDRERQLNEEFRSRMETKPPITVVVQEGAFKSEIVSRVIGSERDLMKQVVAPELLDVIRDGGDEYAMLAGLVGRMVSERLKSESVKS